MAAAALFMASSGTGAVLVRGFNLNGMEFRGELISVTTDTLVVRDSGSDTPLQIGIPLSSLETLAISLPDLPDESTNRDLESLLPALPSVDSASMANLVSYLARRGDSGDWTDVYHWTQRLEAIVAEETLRREIELLKARSLHALGLYRLLDEELTSLGGQVPPVEASPLFCWLQASVLARKELLREARYWARLPFLKIPVPRDPVMDRLADLCVNLDYRLAPNVP
jgi:hypothetical protein